MEWDTYRKMESGLSVTRWWPCGRQNGVSGGAAPCGGPAQAVGGGGSGEGECLDHTCMRDWSAEGWPHTWRGRKWGCMGVTGGNPRVGGASQGLALVVGVVVWLIITIVSGLILGPPLLYMCRF